MPHDILNSMRALREDMRQRLLQVPEYRALVALDHSIDEICVILQDTLAVAAPEPVAPQHLAPQHLAQVPSIQFPQASLPQASLPQASLPQASLPQVHASQAAIPEAAPSRPSAIAAAFAETLAAKIDQRNGARTATYQHGTRVLGG